MIDCRLGITIVSRRWSSVIFFLIWIRPDLRCWEAKPPSKSNSQPAIDHSKKIFYFNVQLQTSTWLQLRKIMKKRKKSSEIKSNLRNTKKLWKLKKSEKEQNPRKKTSQRFLLFGPRSFHACEGHIPLHSENHSAGHKNGLAGHFRLAEQYFGHPWFELTSFPMYFFRWLSVSVVIWKSSSKKDFSWAHHSSL